MTESPFAFQDEDGPATVEQVDQEPGGKRRALIGIGALLALALAGGAFLLVGGDEPTPEVAFAPVKRAPKVQASAVPVPPDTVVAARADAASVGTNPFKALYVEPVAAPAPAAPVAKPPAPLTAPPVVLVTTSQNASGTTTTKVATSPAPAPVVPAPTASPTPKPVPVTRTVLLKQVSTDTGSSAVGTFVLSGETFMGGKGAVLGGKALVKELTKNADGVWMATLQVGDGTPFDVYLGQEVVIQ